MQTGDRVLVYSAFNNSWASGFEIAEVVDDGYRVRRVSDGALLPNSTSERHLRPDS
jgi:hypothetical protein